MKKIFTCMVILVIFPFYLFSQTPETIGKVIDKTKFEIHPSLPKSATEKYWTTKSDYGEIRLGTVWDELNIITDNKDIITIITYKKNLKNYSRIVWSSALSGVNDYFYYKGCREKKSGSLDSSSSSLLKEVLKGTIKYIYEIPNSNILGLFVDYATNKTMTLMFISKTNMAMKFITERTEPVEESILSKSMREMREKEEEEFDGSLGENVTITGQVYNLNNEIEAKLNIPVFVMEEGDNGKMDLELFRGSITNGKLSISLKGNLKKLWSLTKYNINVNEYDISNINAKITILEVSVDPKNGELVLFKRIDDNRYSYVYYVYSDSDVTIKSKKTIKSVIDGYNYETDVDVRLKKGWNCFTERITNVSNNERKLYQRTEKLDSNYRWYLVKE